MQQPGSTRHRVRSTMQRAAAAIAVVTAAAFVAVGCGSGDGDATSELASGGALQWLPTDTWLVATIDVSADKLDDAVQTLDRLPAWALAESYLPASDGQGLRAALMEFIAEQPGEDGPMYSAEELERAFGDRAGAALFGTELTNLTEESAPFVVWWHVDDESRALDAAMKLFDADDAEREHGGVTYFESGDRQTTFAVRDELLLLTTSPEQMQRLIDTREGDDPTLADDETAAAVIEAGVGESMLGVAVNSDPLLAAISTWMQEPGDAVDADAKELLDRLAPVLESGAVDSMVADWMAFSMTIDDVGLRMGGAWSNPRPLADPDPGSRELLERMPAESTSVSASVDDGAMLGRVQAAWKEIAEAGDLDIAQAANCSAREQAWACELGVQLAVALLEDEDLADALDGQDDSATAVVQDLGEAIGRGVTAARGDTASIPAATKRSIEVATTATRELDWKPDDELAAALAGAGVAVSSTDRGGLSIRVRPASPAGRALLQFQRGLGARAAQTPFSVAPLLSRQGLRIEPQEVDGIDVYGIPSGVPSAVVPALEGDAEQLGELDAYREAVDAASPPKQVGSYGWTDLSALIVGALEAVASQSPEVRQAIPTVRNNLADIPGVLSWSAREEVDGTEVGTMHAVIPILE